MSQLEYNGKTIEIPDLKQGEQELDTLDGFPGYSSPSNLEETQPLNIPDNLHNTLILKKPNLVDTQPIPVVKESHGNE